jgi:hypothetical protein
MYQSSVHFSGWFQLKGKSRYSFWYHNIYKICFLNFSFGGLGGLQPGSPPARVRPCLSVCTTVLNDIFYTELCLNSLLGLPREQARAAELTAANDRKRWDLHSYCAWTSWPLKMEPIRCPETSVKDYHSTPRYTPEERKSHQHRGGSLKSRNDKDVRWKQQKFLGP